MKKAMPITYGVRNGVYVNMTNRCNCSCTFCIRNLADGAYGSDPLWLEREPTVQEVIDSLKQWDLSQKDEVVFCGYGEPTERLDDLLEVAAWIKQNYTIPVRINTNGLADLLYGRHTAPLLKDKIDVVSISLNDVTAEDYTRVTRPIYGKKAFAAMQAYATECAQVVPKVVMTVVDEVTTKEEQQKAAEIAASCGAVLRVRPLEK